MNLPYNKNELEQILCEEKKYLYIFNNFNLFFLRTVYCFLLLSNYFSIKVYSVINSIVNKFVVFIIIFLSSKFIYLKRVLREYSTLFKLMQKRKRILFNGEDNASLVIVQITAKYNSDWKNRIVNFIKDLNEDERNRFGLCIV